MSEWHVKSNNGRGLTSGVLEDGGDYFAVIQRDGKEARVRTQGPNTAKAALADMRANPAKYLHPPEPAPAPGPVAAPPKSKRNV